MLAKNDVVAALDVSFNRITDESGIVLGQLLRVVSQLTLILVSIQLVFTILMLQTNRCIELLDLSGSDIGSVCFLQSGNELAILNPLLLYFVVVGGVMSRRLNISNSCYYF